MKIDLNLRKQKRREQWASFLNHYVRMYNEELLLPRNLGRQYQEVLKILMDEAKEDGLFPRHIQKQDIEDFDLDFHPETKRLYEIYIDLKALKTQLVREQKYEESARVRDKERVNSEELFKTAFEAFFGQGNFVVRKENDLLFHPQYSWF